MIALGWYDNLKDAVYLTLCATFELDPESNDALTRFIPAYEFDTTTPQAPRDKNVCYYSISELANTGYEYTMTEYGTIDGVPMYRIKNPIPVSVLFTFYGPNADNDAEHFWMMVMHEHGPKGPRGVLRKHDTLIMDMRPARPVCFDEIFEGTYPRRRADVRLNLIHCNVYEHPSEIVAAPIEFTLEPQSSH